MFATNTRRTRLFTYRLKPNMVSLRCPGSDSCCKFDEFFVCVACTRRVQWDVYFEIGVRKILFYARKIKTPREDLLLTNRVIHIHIEYVLLSRLIFSFWNWFQFKFIPFYPILVYHIILKLVVTGTLNTEKSERKNTTNWYKIVIKEREREREQ